MSVETASYRGAISVYLCDARPLQYAGDAVARLGDGRMSQGWLPPLPAKGTDLLPALRTNPLVKVSFGMGSYRKNIKRREGRDRPHIRT